MNVITSVAKISLVKTCPRCEGAKIMTTHKEIQAWVKQNYGFIPATCWITDVKPNLVCQCGKRRMKRWSPFGGRYVALG
jgi:hypothetical protein